MTTPSRSKRHKLRLSRATLRDSSAEALFECAFSRLRRAALHHSERLPQPQKVLKADVINRGAIRNLWRTHARGSSEN